MGYIEFKIDETKFPMLRNFKKKELEDYLVKIFTTGYTIHFPSLDKMLLCSNQQIELNGLTEKIESIKHELKTEINKSDIGDKLYSLETSLSKLIGISNNSCKKGEVGENVLQEIFSQRYGDITYEKMNNIAHSGDAWLYLPNNMKVILEIKNYTSVVNRDEINKLQFDMIHNHIKWGLMVSFNSTIQGMKELDYHTFVHNNETYSVIMISNLSKDIHKLDLGLQIIRKLITNFENMSTFPWVVQDITNSMNSLNKMIQKNYILRDNYYNMERDIMKNLSSYHVILRDYQYELEQHINEIIAKISNTMKDSVKPKIDNYQNILEKYNNKKILPIIVRLVDIAQNKKWTLELDNDILIKHMDTIIGIIKVQAKKIIFNIINNDISISLHLGKDMENKKNLEFINTI